MADYLTKNRLVTAKVEVTPGTDSTPTPASDAVLVETPRANPNIEMEQTDEVTGSLDSTQPIVGGGYNEHTAVFLAKGSGAAGTAPEFTPYLQAGSMGMTTLASAVTGTAQAGATGSITLAAGAPSSNLTGFVIETTGGTGPGQTRVITAYNTTTKVATVYPNWTVTPDATTTYSVGAGNLFVPVSTGVKTLTQYLYLLNSGSGDAILKKLIGAAADLSFSIQTRQVGRFTATMRGQLVEPESVANPTGQMYDSVRPRPLRDADTFLDGAAVCFRQFTLDWGNTITMADCPGQEFGYESGRVTARAPTGRINPQLKTLAQRNVFADMLAGATKKLWLNWGEDAGNRVSIFLPAIAYTGQEDEDLDGIAAEGIPFTPTGPDGWVYILIH